jgi:nicotinamidase-related amidase
MNLELTGKVVVVTGGTPTTIDPAASALLIMDYQPAILGRVKDGEALLARGAEALAIARRAGMHVGYVRVAFEPADIAAIPATNPVFASAAPTMPADAPHTQVHERIAPRAGDIVVRKTRVGAFSTTDLDAKLRARGVTTLVLAGISTSGVVLSTVRDAADRDYRVVVLADGCADTDDEVHRVLVTKVFPRQARVMEIGELAGALASTAESRA